MGLGCSDDRGSDAPFRTIETCKRNARGAKGCGASRTGKSCLDEGCGARGSRASRAKRDAAQTRTISSTLRHRPSGSAVRIRARGSRICQYGARGSRICQTFFFASAAPVAAGFFATRGATLSNTFRHTAVRACKNFSRTFCSKMDASTHICLDHIAGCSQTSRMS